MKRFAWSRLAAVLCIATLTACAGGEDAGEDAAADEEAQEQTEAAVPAESAASVEGTISFEGEPPSLEPIDMTEEATCAEQYDEDPMTQEVLVEDGGLANVFVHVTEGLDRSFPTPSESVTLDQVACRYQPHVFGVQVDQDLVIRNSDGILHNINAQPEENRGFNRSQPGAIEELPPVQFSIPEVMIPVRCDVHGWMNAYVGVTEHPFHAVSSADGSFTLEGLPPGEYVLEAWHEVYGTQTATVTVAAGETGSASFTFSADAASADVPLGDPLVVGHDGTVERVPSSDR